MKCYFCQEELYDTERNGFFDCQECSQKISGKGSVTMVTDAQGLLYAHIYIDRTTSHTYHMPNIALKIASGPRSYTTGHVYHFRLHIREGFTNFGAPSDYEFNDICKITGFPVNPSNAEEKMKLYLLFS